MPTTIDIEPFTYERFLNEEGIMVAEHKLAHSL